MKKKNLKKLLYPLIAVGLIALVYQTIDPEETYENIKNANYFWVVVASLVALLSHFVRAVRWRMLIEPLGYKTSLKTSFYAVITGYAVNYAVPRAGEVARCALKSRTDDIPVDKLVGTVVTERIFDLIITLMVTAAAFIFQYQRIGEFFSEQFQQGGDATRVKLLILGGVVLFGVVGIWFFRRLKRNKNNNPFVKKLLDFLSGLMDGAKSIFKLKKPGLFLFYTLMIWVLYFTAPYLLFLSVEGTSHLGFDAALTTLVVATFAIIIPAPGGIGSFHYFVPLGLTLYGIEKSIGTSYAFITHTSHMIMILVVFGVSMGLLALDRRKEKKRHESS